MLNYLRPACLKIFPTAQNLLVHLPICLFDCVLEVDDVVVDVNDVLLAIVFHRLTALTYGLQQISPGFIYRLHDISPCVVQTFL